MTDMATIVALAYDLGTVKRVTKKFAYISNLRYRFDDAQNLVDVREPVPGGKDQWRPVREVKW